MGRIGGLDVPRHVARCSRFGGAKPRCLKRREGDRGRDAGGEGCCSDADEKMGIGMWLVEDSLRHACMHACMHD